MKLTYRELVVKQLLDSLLNQMAIFIQVIAKPLDLTLNQLRIMEVTLTLDTMTLILLKRIRNIQTRFWKMSDGWVTSQLTFILRQIILDSFITMQLLLLKKARLSFVNNQNKSRRNSERIKNLPLIETLLWRLTYMSLS